MKQFKFDVCDFTQTTFIGHWNELQQKKQMAKPLTVSSIASYRSFNKNASQVESPWLAL